MQLSAADTQGRKLQRRRSEVGVGEQREREKKRRKEGGKGKGLQPHFSITPICKGEVGNPLNNSLILRKRHPMKENLEAYQKKKEGPSGLRRQSIAWRGSRRASRRNLLPLFCR